jgi:hypothetical protein
MTSIDLSDLDLAALLRATAKHAVQQAEVKIRTPKQIAGTVEDLNDEENDVIWTRVDAQAFTDDPMQTINYEFPGVIPSVRIGETFMGDQVRITFDDAGASAQRTSALKQLVIPFGAEIGERIRIYEEEGKGYIAFFNEQEELTGILEPEIWEIGDLSTPGRRVTIDPLGGIRIRSDDDRLVSIMNDLGYSLRDPVTGTVTAEIQHGSFRLVDQNGVDDIEMVTSSDGTLPNPAYRSAPEVNPSSSLVIPAAPLFTTPLDDISIGHVAAWKRATNQAATMTPPAGGVWTEQDDSNVANAAGTLQTSVATRDPADGLTATFTSTQTNWEHAIGTHVTLKGGGATSPSFRSKTTSSVVTTASQVAGTVAKPTGLAVGDVMLVFVSLGVNGGGLPVGWTVPIGFKQLGANFSMSGTGATQTTCASGAWVKLADADDVAATEFGTTINLPTGTKILQTTMVAIQNAFLVPGGVQIRMSGKPIRRLLKFNELTSAATTLCDFQNIEQGYDNLELIIDSSAAAAGSDTRCFLRFNGNVTGNVFSRLTQLHNIAASSVEGSVTAIRCGAVSGSASAQSSGAFNIYGYTQLRRRVVLGRHYWVDSSVLLRDDMVSAQWDNTADPITRIVFDCTKSFAIGSRAYLYGY